MHTEMLFPGKVFKDGVGNGSISDLDCIAVLDKTSNVFPDFIGNFQV